MWRVFYKNPTKDLLMEQPVLSILKAMKYIDNWDVKGNLDCYTITHKFIDLPVLQFTFSPFSGYICLSHGVFSQDECAALGNAFVPLLERKRSLDDRIDKEKNLEKRKKYQLFERYYPL